MAVVEQLAHVLASTLFLGRGAGEQVLTADLTYKVGLTTSTWRYTHKTITVPINE